MTTFGFNKILLQTSSATGNEKATALAVSLARNYKATLVVLGVVDRMLVNRMQRFSERSLAEIEVEMEEDIWKYLFAIEDEAKDLGVRTLIMQRTGNVAEEVLGAVERLHVDLIIMDAPPTSAHSRRLAHGNVERVIEHVQAPVLVVK